MASNTMVCPKCGGLMATGLAKQMGFQLSVRPMTVEAGNYATTAAPMPTETEALRWRVRDLEWELSQYRDASDDMSPVALRRQVVEARARIRELEAKLAEAERKLQDARDEDDIDSMMAIKRMKIERDTWRARAEEAERTLAKSDRHSDVLVQAVVTTAKEADAYESERDTLKAQLATLRSLGEAMAAAFPHSAQARAWLAAREGW